MSDDEKKSILNLSQDAAWQEAIHTLYRDSLRRRKIEDTKDLPVVESIRGNLPRQKHPDLYKSVDQNIKSRLVHAAADTICKLIERDEVEAQHRYKRWQSRDLYGWDKLEEPRPVGHILAFFPTTATIELCSEVLQKRLPGLPGNNQVFLYHRELSDDDKEHVTEKAGAESGLRKIILGTNLAETSLTLDGLVYVVDTGLILQTFYNPEIKGLDYPTILHSFAGCRQRLGRVGRKEPGEGYRLYTRKELKEHPPYTTPEVTRSDPAQLILNLVSAGLPPSFIHQNGALMQPPDRNWIDTALTDLKKLKAIDKDGDLTRRGTELMTIPENNLLSAVLLCEADRFGCLWEMSVFLCFIGLSDKVGPDGQAKCLSLWVPDNRKVFEDQLEEKLFDEGDLEDDKTLSTSDTIWSNPYIQGNALIKQQALRCGCLDDLEVYLRIWQGWTGQGDNPERRAAWAFDHGVSAEALLRVERALGLDPKDTSETGMLRHFWAFSQKGIMKRDIHFEALDKVRYLYAAANHDKLFARSTEGTILPCNGILPVQGQRMEIQIQPESVWNNKDINNPMRFNNPAELQNLVANAKIKPRNKKPSIQVLRHVVWLEPKWVQNGLPSLFDDPVHLAKKFSEYSDQYLIHYGRWPFARGSQLCGLAWPMPGFPVPPPMDIQQWRIRYASGISSRAKYPAIYRHSITGSENTKAMGFVQLMSGPLLPMLLGKARPSLGEYIDVLLKYDDISESLWAVQPKPRVELPDPLLDSKNEITRTSIDIKESVTTGPESESHMGKMAPAKISAKVIPIQRLEPVDLQKQLPANSVVGAEFIKCAPSQNMAWITVSIQVSTGQKNNWSFPVHQESDMTQFKDVPVGKQCRVRIKKWVSDKRSGQTKPLLVFHSWI